MSFNTDELGRTRKISRIAEMLTQISPYPWHKTIDENRPKTSHSKCFDEIVIESADSCPIVSIAYDDNLSRSEMLKYSRISDSDFISQAPENISYLMEHITNLENLLSKATMAKLTQREQTLFDRVVRKTPKLGRPTRNLAKKTTTLNT